MLWRGADNGDFEFYSMGGQLRTLSDMQTLLVEMLNSPMKAGVDSMAVAGMMDLLITKGIW